MYLHIGNFAPEKKTILEPTALYILEDSTHSEGQLTLGGCAQNYKSKPQINLCVVVA